jgi:hypothetical protein
MAATIITTHAREQNSFVITLDFTDETGLANTPIALTWTLSDMDGNVVNSRSAASATTIATTSTIVMVGSDTVIIAGQTNERLLLIEWTYNSSYGSAMVGKAQAILTIDELVN